MFEDYEPEVRMLEYRRESDPLRSGGSVLFYGSSSIRLWETLAADLGESRARNLGFGGSTLAACAHYCRRLVIPYRPSSIVVYAGDNDLGDGRTPEEVRASFADLRAQIDADLGPIPLAFVAIKPSPARWPIVEEIRSANNFVKSDLATRPNSDYIDVHTPMLGPGVRPDPVFFAPDGLHLSAAGYRLWTRIILGHKHSIF